MMVTHNEKAKVTDPLLLELCGLYGVLRSYRGADRREVNSPQSSIVAVLRSLGAELPGGEGPPAARELERAILARKLEKWRRIIEPVVVAWEGRLPALTVRLPRGFGGQVRISLVLEDGAILERAVGPEGLRPTGAVSLGRAEFEAWTVGARRPRSWPARLPLGYHRLVVEAGGVSSEAAVISAPRRCWTGEDTGRDERGGGATASLGDTGRARAPHGEWGIFAPLYALRSERDWGAGDLAELEALADWTGERGGSVVATLPLLASFLVEPFDPSPYRPVSRMFWNEFYLAVERIPEWERCSEAREIWQAPGTGERLQSLRAGDFVNYRGVMALKRSVIEAMARCFFSAADPNGYEALARWMRESPESYEYARFRAEMEERGAAAEGTSPGRAQGHIGALSGLSFRGHYHLYCQWQMGRQLDALDRGDAGARRRAGLFLDLPVGVHPSGFDTWRWSKLFAHEMSTGAPPDDFFTLGQDWHSPPIRPDRLRQDGHRYFVSCLRHQMRHAAYLRVDHIMSLHRLFWIPSGVEAADGVYASYPAEEAYAVLSRESQLGRVVVVGEDLGTVPPEVRPAMRRHRVSRTWVVQPSLRQRTSEPMGPIPVGTIAAVNTHDMAPFAGFLAGGDILTRLRTGQVDRAAAHREEAVRQELVERLRHWTERQPAEAAPVHIQRCGARGAGQLEDGVVLRAVLARLMGSGARLTLVNLEDLGLETRPQNVPGAEGEWPNWRRRASDAIKTLSTGG